MTDEHNDATVDATQGVAPIYSHLDGLVASVERNADFLRRSIDDKLAQIAWIRSSRDSALEALDEERMRQTRFFLEWLELLETELANLRSHALVLAGKPVTLQWQGQTTDEPAAAGRTQET
jgi:hypothetical protein